MKIKRTAAFLAKIAQHGIDRHACGTKEQVQLQLNWLHFRPECHPHHLLTVRELKAPELKVCQLDLCIYIHLFLTLDFSMSMHMPRIACAIKILFQICWLMKNHPLVSTLPAAWYYNWYQFCRWKQPSERTSQWRRELINGNRIIEYYHYLQSSDTLQYILKDIFIFIIKEPHSDKGEHTWTW